VRLILGWLWCILSLFTLGQAQAQAVVEPMNSPVTLERTAEGLFLSARLPLELPAGLQDVLYKGVPLHFVWRVDLVRSRWYWWDEAVVSHNRVVRLAYQPLTRRWRLSVDNGSADDASGMSALHQTVETLDEAMAVVARVSSWRLADGARLHPKETYRLDFNFYLDGSKLPRPFQIGQGGSVGQSLRIELQFPVPAVPS